MKEVDVAVLGSTGATGEELVAILKEHPGVSSVTTPSSREALDEFEGRDLVYSALPNGASSPHVGRLRDLGCTVIDLADDLRLPSAELWEKWRPGKAHPAPHLVSADIPYGLPELNRDQLEPGVELVAMPGCYPTPTLLTLVPLLEQGLIDLEVPAQVTGLSGYSGRGRKHDNSDLIDEAGVGHNTKPYKPGREHQHIPEMEQLLGEETLSFTPFVLPNERGLLVNIGVQLAEGVAPSDLRDALEERYGDEPFVAVCEEGTMPDITSTTHTHECHIGVGRTTTRRTAQLIGGIDNLLKGSASQAVQVGNLLTGFPETTRLTPKAGWSPATD